MIVGHDVAIVSVDDDARASALRPTSARHIKKPPEKRVFQQRVGRAHRGVRCNIDHRRVHAVEHIRKTGQLALAGHSERQRRGNPRDAS